ncbi:MAG: rod shape-determining protein MreC [Abitibacteriaceae bacterium]|nr:rod shape-determining protein MreC [Abditibacteriaceae bacterium]
MLLALCLGLVFWYKAAQGRGGISVPESGAFLVLRPVQRTFSGVGAWAADVGRTVFHRGSIISENEKLQGRIADLEGQNQRLVRYRRENEELRRLLNMPKQTAGKLIAADVISFDFTDYKRIMMLNVGTRQGVRPKDVVFTARGVVGQVISATAWPPTCKVQMLTDRISGVGAMTDRTMAKGVVQGTGEGVCKLAYLDYQADVREGDLVLTSGLSLGRGAIFPKGLVIGRVLKVERDKYRSEMTAYVDPSVPFDQINAVYVRVQTGT